MHALLLLLACAAEPPAPSAEAAPKSVALPPETDLPDLRSGAWPLGPDATLELSQGALHLRRADSRELVRIELVGVPAVSGARAVLAHRDDGQVVSTLETLELRDGELLRRVVTKEGAPDRVAISEDGAWIAWVSGATGIASVYAQPFEGGEAVQLTNVDLTYTPGQAPEGFVPPPHEGPLLFDEGRLRWQAPEGPQEVKLP
ncbi:MAG: hypothetical protein H6741_17865 [Alphaproteobacteria bacterium]|nr:hypothetical protein [Alphaproteobacteria bacterium]MCB9794587.1 hypothetical protein [Alphaproteobacteria bacterium]